MEIEIFVKPEELVTFLVFKNFQAEFINREDKVQKWQEMFTVEYLIRMP